MKFGVEHFRRRKPHCSGTLIWQLNDCWPVLSWSLIDYEGFGKPAYWFARRFYAPVLASFRAEADGAVELWLTNDTARPVGDVAIVRLSRFAGGAPLAAVEVAAEVPAHASRALRRFEPGELPAGPDRYLTVSAAGGSFARNRHFFAAIKDLDRTAPRVRCDVEAVGRRELAVRLRADAYAYFVSVTLDDPEARPSDNYVELEPGEQRVISVRSDGSRLDPERLSVRSR
jgi:beta-mannosidase